MEARTDAMIGILQHVRRILELSGTDVVWSGWENVDEALADIHQQIARLQRDDLSQLDALSLLFAPTGRLQETSISSGWGDDFIAIATQFDLAVAALRRNDRD